LPCSAAAAWLLPGPSESAHSVFGGRFAWRVVILRLDPPVLIVPCLIPGGAFCPGFCHCRFATAYSWWPSGCESGYLRRSFYSRRCGGPRRVGRWSCLSIRFSRSIRRSFSTAPSFLRYPPLFGRGRGMVLASALAFAIGLGPFFYHAALPGTPFSPHSFPTKPPSPLK
jgi:hypothetical protein